MRNKIVAGNWKMNLDLESAKVLSSEIVHMYEAGTPHLVKVILIPPFPFLSEVKHLVKHNSQFSVAAQNLHAEEKGAFTGEVSGNMIYSTGARNVLIGHSERRQLFSENNSLFSKKISRALSCGLQPIYCIGEILEERESGNMFEVIKSQLSEGIFHLSKEDLGKSILAYEPVWAIGTGKTATPGQAQEVHSFIRNELSKKYNSELAEMVPILYGGSVTPSNAYELFSMPDIDGGLVGGASLKSKDFCEIISSAGKAMN